MKHSNHYDSSKSASFDESEFWNSMGVHEPTCLFGKIKSSTVLKLYTAFSCLMGIYWMFQTKDNSSQDVVFIFEHFWFYAICSLFPFIGFVGLTLKKRSAIIIYGIYLLCGLVLIMLLGVTGITMVMKENFCFKLRDQLQWNDSTLSKCLNQTLSIRILVTSTTIIAIFWQLFILYSIQKYHDYLYRTSWTTVPDDQHDLAMQYHRI